MPAFADDVAFLNYHGADQGIGIRATAAAFRQVYRAFEVYKVAWGWGRHQP
jgi:hypothetical protein